MTVWRFVVPGTKMGERIVPAPHDPSGSGQALIKRTGTWIHEQDWPYVKSLQFPCRGIMKNGFMEGSPDSRQMSRRPPEPLPAPPPAFFEIPIGPAPPVSAFPEELEATEPPQPRYKKGSRR